MAASLTPVLQKLNKLKEINNKAKFDAQCIKLAATRVLKNKFKISNYKKDDIIELCKLHPAFAWRLISLINKANKSTTSLDKADPSAKTSDNGTISVKGIAQLHPNDFQIQLVAAGKASENRIPVVIQFLDPDKCNEATKNFFVFFDNYTHLISEPIELTQYESCIKKLTFEEEKLSRSLLAILSDEEIIPINKHKNISSPSDILITTVHISVAKEVLTPSFVKVLLSFLGLSRNISQEISTSAIIKRINDSKETEINKLDLIEILLAKRVLQRQYWKDLTKQEWKSLTNYLKDKHDVRSIKLYNIAIERAKFLENKIPGLATYLQQAENKPNPESFEHTNISNNNDSHIVPVTALNNELIIPPSDEVIENLNPEKPSVRIDLNSLDLEGQDKGETYSKATKNLQRTNSTNKLLDSLYKNNFRTTNQDIVNATSPNLSQNALSLELSQSSTVQKEVNHSQTTAPIAALTNDAIVPSSDQVNEFIEKNIKAEKPSARIDLSSLHLEGRDNSENHLKAAKKLHRTNSTNKLLDLLYKNNFKTDNQNIVDAISSNISQNVLSLEQSLSSKTQQKVINNQTVSSFAMTLDSHVNTSAFASKQALTLDQSKQTSTFEQSRQALTLDQSKQTSTFEQSRQALTLDQSKQALTLEQSKSIQALTLSSSKNAVTLDSSSSTHSKKNSNSFIDLSISDIEFDENEDESRKTACDENNHQQFLNGSSSCELEDESNFSFSSEKPIFINENNPQPTCNTPSSEMPFPAEFANISPIIASKSDIKKEPSHSYSQANRSTLQAKFKKTFEEIIAASEQQNPEIDKQDNSAAISLNDQTQDKILVEVGENSDQGVLSLSYDVKDETNNSVASKSVSNFSAISLDNSILVPSPIKCVN